MDRAWNLPLNVAERHRHRAALIKTKSPHITTDMLNDHVKATGVMVDSAASIFQHPNHSREHVDSVLNNLDRASGLAKESPLLSTEGAHKMVREALTHSPHINDDDIHRLLTRPALSDKYRKSILGTGNVESLDHTQSILTANRIMEMPKLKPEHITTWLNNPHITTNNTLDTISRRKDLTPEHEHKILDIADKFFQKNEGSRIRVSNPDGTTTTRSRHWLESEADHREYVPGFSKFLHHMRDPDAIHRVIEHGFSEPIVTLTKMNPNLNQSHIEAIDQLHAEGKLKTSDYNLARANHQNMMRGR
jgi:hypothetical protein